MGPLVLKAMARQPRALAALLSAVWLVQRARVLWSPVAPQARPVARMAWRLASPLVRFRPVVLA